MKKRSFLVVILVIVTAVLAGCAGPIHQLERQGLVQLTSPAPIQVRPGGKYVMAQCRDSTGYLNNLQSSVNNELRNRGKAVVSDVKNADYILNGQVTSINYQRDTSRITGGGATIGGLLLGGLAGGLTGGLTGSPGWGFGAGALGAAAGAAIGHQLDQQVAPGIVIAKVHIRVDERINFLGERRVALPLEPIKKYRRVLKKTKSGKKVWVQEKVTETEESETPVHSTVATARSGSGTATIVTDRRVAQFVPHQAEIEVKLVVEQSTTMEEIKQRLEQKIAAAMANSI